ncbi:MAG: AsmA family protein, partial [Casimicrobiaceae bacterium]
MSDSLQRAGTVDSFMDMAAASPHSRWLWRTLLGVVALFLVSFVVLLFFPWNTLREPFADYLTTKSGRKVTIDGDLSVKLAWHPWVEIRGLSIANAVWSDQPVMVAVDRIGMRVVPFSFFTRLRIPEIEFEAPRAILERSKAGEKNWKMGDSAGATDAGDPPLVGRVRVTDGVLRYRDPDPNLRLDVKVHALTAADRQGKESLVFSGDGRLRGGRFRIAGQGEGLGALREFNEPFSLVFNAKADDAEAWFDGTIVPNQPDNVHGFIKIVGKDMSQLYPLLPAPIPWTPPYQLKGDVAHLPDRWKVTNLSGTVGRSDLAGTVEIFTTTPRRKLVADLTSTRLDYRDLGGFVGLPPGRETAARSAPQKAAAQRLARTDRIFQDQRLELDKLREYDAEFHFRGKSIHVDRVPMDNVDMKIVLDNGVLSYAPVKVGIADGQVILVGTLDANAVPPRVDVRIEGRNLDFARIYPELASPRGKTGRFGGFIKLKSQGVSVAKMARAADGQGALIMSGGEASALTLLLTNLDLAGVIPLIIGGDKTASLYCAVSAFAVNDGVLTPR